MANNMTGFSWDAAVTQAQKRYFARGVLGMNDVATVNGKDVQTDATLTISELEVAAAPYLYREGHRMCREYFRKSAIAAASATSIATTDSSLPLD